MTSITYPGSRANASNCILCNIGGGQMKDDGYTIVTTEDGTSHRLMKRTCWYCGFTIFFEPEVARRAPYSGGDTEIFPE
jgi:hypothetical protein